MTRFERWASIIGTTLIFLLAPIAGVAIIIHALEQIQ